MGRDAAMGRDAGSSRDAATTDGDADRRGPPWETRTVSELTFAELLAGALAAYRDT
jgi:hypothetical protein